MYVSIGAGALLLFVGGEWLIRGAVRLAGRAGLSPLLIGMTVVAAATSAPELVVSLQAALEGSPDIALGNVVGSNTSNVLLVLGLSALIRPIAVDARATRKDAAAVLCASVALLIATQQPQIGRMAGALFLGGLVAFIWWSFRAEARAQVPGRELHEAEAETYTRLQRHPAYSAALVGVGLLALVIGARLFVHGAVAVAARIGLSEAVIGLTVVALGTSLPELSASGIAALRGHGDVVTGNVLGSNLFNIAAIIGTTALVTPIGVNPEIASLDVWLMLAALLVVLPLVVWRGHIGRVAGVVMLAAYVAYVVILVV